MYEPDGFGGVRIARLSDQIWWAAGVGSHGAEVEFYGQRIPVGTYRDVLTERIDRYAKAEALGQLSVGLEVELRQLREELANLHARWRPGEPNNAIEG